MTLAMLATWLSGVQGAGDTRAYTLHPSDLAAAIAGVTDDGAPGATVEHEEAPAARFNLPREPGVSTSRHAFDPLPPVPAAIVALRADTGGPSAPPAAAAHPYDAPPSQADAWASLRTPAGPPAA